MSNFHPDTGGRRWSLFSFSRPVLLRGGQGAAGRYRCVWGALEVFRPHWVCPVQGCLCFPRLHCSGSRLLYRERALRCLPFQFSGSPQKHGLGWACILCFPRPSSSGNQELAGCTLPDACAFSPPRAQPWFPCAPVRCACDSSGELISSCDPPGGCQPSRISRSLWLETGSLFAVW